jgi:cold-inducible RNA-binding protein
MADLRGSSGDDGEGRKIFVGGLAIDVSKEAVRNDFGKFGEVEDVFMPTDRETGNTRGFGFVTYKESRDAQDAADAMHG